MCVSFRVFLKNNPYFHVSLDFEKGGREWFLEEKQHSCIIVMFCRL